MGISTIQNDGVDTNRTELFLVRAELVGCLIDESTAEDFPMKEHLLALVVYSDIQIRDNQ